MITAARLHRALSSTVTAGQLDRGASSAIDKSGQKPKATADAYVAGASSAAPTHPISNKLQAGFDAFMQAVRKEADAAGGSPDEDILQRLGLKWLNTVAKHCKAAGIAVEVDKDDLLLRFSDTSTRIGLFSASASNALDVDVAYHPLEQLSGVEGSFCEFDRMLFLSPAAVIALRPGITEMHEARHAMLTHVHTDRGIATALDAWIKPTESDQFAWERISNMSPHAYSTGFSLEELSTFALEMCKELGAVRRVAHASRHKQEQAQGWLQALDTSVTKLQEAISDSSAVYLAKHTQTSVERARKVVAAACAKGRLAQASKFPPQFKEGEWHLTTVKASHTLSVAFDSEYDMDDLEDAEDGEVLATLSLADPALGQEIRLNIRCPQQAECVLEAADGDAQAFSKLLQNVVSPWLQQLATVAREQVRVYDALSPKVDELRTLIDAHRSAMKPDASAVNAVGELAGQIRSLSGELAASARLQRIVLPGSI